jgi:hypothetical protein
MKVIILILLVATTIICRGNDIEQRAKCLEKAKEYMSTHSNWPTINIDDTFYKKLIECKFLAPDTDKPIWAICLMEAFNQDIEDKKISYYGILSEYTQKNFAYLIVTRNYDDCYEKKAKKTNRKLHRRRMK